MRGSHPSVFTKMSSMATSALEACPSKVLNWNRPLGNSVSDMLKGCHDVMVDVDMLNNSIVVDRAGDE